jgi:hypothetical protein
MGERCAKLRGPPNYDPVTGESSPGPDSLIKRREERAYIKIAKIASLKKDFFRWPLITVDSL